MGLWWIGDGLMGGRLEWLHSPNAASWALVIVAVVGIAVAIRTLREMEQQTRVTAVAATAAKDSADALVNSERAWVVVEGAKLFRTQDGRSQEARPIIKNFGKTIARIRKVSLGDKRPRRGETEQLPSIPGYGRCEDFDFVLCPDLEFPEHEAIGIIITQDALNDMETNVFNWYVYGLIEYFDLAGKERSTGFVLLYRPNVYARPIFLPYLKAPSAYYKTT